MDLEKIWNGHIAATDGLPEVKTLTGENMRNRYSPLKKIKRAVKINSIWAAALAIVYIVIIYAYPFWQVRLFIGVTLIFNIWGIISGWQLYQSVNDDIWATNLLAELKRNRTALITWMRLQTRVALCIYPFSICGGFLLGGVLGSGKSVEFFMTKPIVWYSLIASELIITPLAYMAAKWMFTKSFGKVLSQIDQTISDISADGPAV